MEALPEQPLLHHLRIRENIRALLKSVGLDRANRVPEGFNNNLLWNAGHVIATQEQLVYGLSGKRMPSGTDFINIYRRGTRPEGPATSEGYEFILKELLEGNVRLREIGADTDWSEYKVFETMIGITLHDVQEALIFNNQHEMLHLGTMLALRKLV